MKVLAIDPGDTESGICLMDGYKPWKADKLSNDDTLKIIDTYSTWADAVVIEMVASYGMAVGKSVFDTCVWIGRFWEAYRQHTNFRKPVELIYRMEEKMVICHDSRAKDTNIRQALIDRFAEFDKKTGKGTKKKPDWFYGFSKDAWMAYAVGVTFLDKKQEEITQR